MTILPTLIANSTCDRLIPSITRFMKAIQRLINDPKLVIALCLFLGFAPFYPEPHLFGKIRWVAGGAVGMQPLDVFDLLWHSFPFFLLMRIGILRLRA